MSLNFDITGDNRSFINSINQVTEGVRNATRQIEANGGDIDRVISMIKNGVAALGVATGLKEFASQISSVRGEFQKLEVAFETMLGNKEQSDALMAQMIRTAAITPFGMTDVTNGAKSLLAYGVAAEEVNDILIRLGDIAAGLSISLNDLTYLYGTTIVQGRMFTQDLRQFQGRGIPIAAELAKQFGVAENKVGDLVTAGKVGSKEFIQAIKSMTDEGSKFGGLMEKQSQTISGQISNIEDAIEQMFNEIGKESEGIIDATLSATSTIVENWQAVGLILADIAAAYGVEKAIIVGTAAVAASSYEAEITALSGLLPVKQQATNLDIAEAVAKGKITEATAAKLIAIRAEHQTYLQSLADAKAAALNEQLLAKQKLQAAAQQSVAAKAALAAKREELIASGEICGAYISENATKQINTLQTNVNTTSEKLNVAIKQSSIATHKATVASKALDTATTEANTVAQNLNTRSTNILTVAKETLSKSVKKLYATLAAHPYALLTAAVLALGYGIYKLVTYQSEYQKSLKRLDEALNKNNQAIISEELEINRLFDKLKNAKKGTEEWEKAKDSIWSKYGQYLKSLGDEKTALNDVAAAYSLVRQEAEKAAKARAMESYVKSEEDTYAEKIGNLRSKAISMVEERYGKEFASKHEQDIIAVVEGTKTPADSFIQTMNSKNGFFGRSGNFTRLLAEAQEARNVLNKSYKNAEQKFGTIYQTSTKTTTTEEPNLQEAYDKAKKDYEDAKAKVDKMNADRKAFTQKEYEEATANLKEYKEAYEKLGGETKEAKGQTAAQRLSKTAAEEQQLTDLLKRQAEERLRQQQSYEYELWQNRIDLMDEGEAKVLAQMRLNNAKEETALKERQEQEIQAEIAAQKAVFDAREDTNASKDKKYAKKVFDPTKDVDTSAIDAINQRYEQLYTDLAAKQAKAEQDRLDAAKESMNAYLQEFGNYQQKRLSIQEEYETKIAKAQNEGERMTLFAQRDKALSDLDYSEWVDSGDMALAFGDIAKLSDSTIERLIADMERYREKVIATFDPEKIREYEEALTKLRDAQTENSFGIFAEVVPEYFKQRKSVADQKDSAAENINAVYEKRAEIYNRIFAIQERIKAAEANGEDTTQLNNELKEQEVALQGTDAAARKATNAFKQLQEQWDKLNSPEEKFYGICEAVAQATDMIGGLTDNLGSMLDAMGAGGLASAVGTLGEAMDSVGNIASGFAQGGPIGGIAAAAGEAMKWVGKLFAAGDKKHQKNIERLQEQIDALNKSYDKLGNAAEEAFSTDTSELIDQQNTLLAQQKVLIQRQIAEEEAKKKTDKEKVKQWKEQLEEIDEAISDNKKKAKEAIVGEDIKSAISEFADAYASAWEDGTDAASKSMSAVKNILKSALTELLNKTLQPKVQEFYDLVAKYAEGGFTEYELNALDVIKRQIDAASQSLEEQFKTIEDRYKDLDELKEELTDISFDSVRDNFKSQLLDMEADASDFTESFTDMLRSAVVEGLMDNKYDAMLKEWYDEFAEAMDNQTLTDEERDSLRQQYQSIIDQGIADRNAINEIIGGGAYSQSASQGGWETMGQDQAEELNGRFTALTELQVISNDLQQTQNTLAAQILATLQGMSLLSGAGSGNDPTLLAIKDMMFLQTGYLEDIARYTKILNSVDERLATLNNSIDRKL